MIQHNEIVSISPIERPEWENMDLQSYWKELRLKSALHAFCENILIVLCN